MNQSWSSVLAIAISVSGTLISALVLRTITIMDKKNDERNEAKVRESCLIIDSIYALGKLAEAEALAIKNGRANGELEDALRCHRRARSKLSEHLTEQAARVNHGG